MGNAFSCKDVRLLIAGLDAAGKTSTPPCIDRARSLDRHSPRSLAAILLKLKNGPKRVTTTVSTIPTLNFNVENCSFKGMNFSIWVRSPRHTKRRKRQ